MLTAEYCEISVYFKYNITLKQIIIYGWSAIYKTFYVDYFISTNEQTLIRPLNHKNSVFKYLTPYQVMFVFYSIPSVIFSMQIFVNWRLISYLA